MSKRRLTRSTGYWSLRGRTGGAWRLGTSDGEQAPVAHEPHGRWPPRDQHRDARRPPRSPAWRASLSPPRTEYLVVVDFGYLRLENFVAHAPGIGQLVTMGVSRTLGAMHADAREHLADRPGRKRPAVVLDEGAEDFEFRSHSARGTDTFSPCAESHGAAPRLSDTLSLSNQLRPPHPPTLPIPCLPCHHTITVIA